MNFKHLLSIVLCYVAWGFIPLYLQLFDSLDPLFIVCSRIAFSCFLSFIWITARSQWRKYIQMITDKKIMKFLIPAALLLALNWCVFTLAVKADRILDASLGLYMNPLVMIALNAVIFKAKMNKFEWIAICLMVLGVTISIIRLGTIPYMAFMFAFTLSIYSTIKKKVALDPIVSIAAEMSIIMPLSLITILVVFRGQQGLASFGILEAIFMLGAGAITVFPMALYNRGINELQYTTVAFLQYILPTMSLIIALLQGETLTTDKIITFIFIGLGLIVYSFSLIAREKIISQNK